MIERGFTDGRARAGQPQPAPSKEEAIPWIKKFLAVAGDGESEVRQLWDQEG
jgi:hypothetical protein